MKTLRTASLLPLLVLATACAEMPVEEESASVETRTTQEALTEEPGGPLVCDEYFSQFSNFYATNYMALFAGVTSEAVHVQVDGYPDFTLQEVRIWTGAPGDIPLQDNGIADWDAFPYVYEPGITGFIAELPWPDTVGCGDELKIAVYIESTDGEVYFVDEDYVYLTTCCVPDDDGGTKDDSDDDGDVDEDDDSDDDGDVDEDDDSDDDDCRRGRRGHDDDCRGRRGRGHDDDCRRGRGRGHDDRGHGRWSDDDDRRDRGHGRWSDDDDGRDRGDRGRRGRGHRR